MKNSITTLLLILFSSALTLNFSTATHPALLFIAPGFLFGLAITIPLVLPNYKDYWSELKLSILYPMTWASLLAFSFLFEFFGANWISYIFTGLISGFFIAMTFDWQFGFRKKSIAFPMISSFSIISILLSDNFFPSPYDKELNIGKQIALWQILVGLGILFNKNDNSIVHKQKNAL